jgi:hypothetical protein
MNKFIILSLILTIAMLQLVSAAEYQYFQLVDLDITVDGDSVDNIDLDTSNSVDEVEPGDKVKIEVEVENLYPDTQDYEDYEIEDLEFEIDIDGFCDEDDLEYTESGEDLSPGNDHEETIEFEIPRCADEDYYDIDIRIEANNDETGEKYVITRSITIEVEKLTTELEIMEPVLTPTTVSCDRDIEIEIEVRNIGSKDEDDAGLLIINNDLNINEFEFFDIEAGDYDDEDTHYSETFHFTVPDDVPAGEYKIKSEIEYYKNNYERKQYVYLMIEDCETVEDSEEEADNDDEADDDTSEEDTTDDTETTTDSIVTETDVGSSLIDSGEETNVDAVEVDDETETLETEKVDDEGSFSLVLLGVIALVAVLAIALVIWFGLLLTEK